VRHGETEWSRSGRHTGSTDLELTAEGEERARELGRRLAGPGFATAWSSPLRRALRTAALAGFPHPVVTDLLREFDYGEYEGLTTAEIRRRRPGWELFRDGCPGGETPEQVERRAAAFVEAALSAGGDAVAFAHGHVLRAVATAFLGLEVAVAARLALDTASISVLRTGERGRLLQLWNQA
jgi:probable phosphoglycerate mutase